MIGNHLFFIDIFLLTIYAIVFVTVSYSLGVFIFNIQSSHPTRKAFFNTVFGLLLVIGLYSIICTGFKTVNIFSLCILGFIAKDNKQFFNTKNLAFKNLLPFLYIFPVVFTLYGVYILQTSIENDVKYYSKIAYELRENGYENFYHFYNSYDSKFNGVVPYHYIELWLASFFNFTTGTLTVFSLKYFTYPFLMSLFIYSYLATVQTSKFLFFMVVLGLSLFPLTRYLSIIDIGWDFICDFWLRPNFIPYYLLFGLFYNAIIDNNFKFFYLLLALSLTFSIAIVPSIILSLFLINIWFVLAKNQTLKQSISYVFPSVLVLMGMLVMYSVVGSKINVTTDFSIKEMIMYNLKIWKAILVTSSVLILEGGIMIGAMFLYNKLTSKVEMLNRFLLFVFLLLISGVFMFQVFSQVDNSYQFPYFSYAGVGFIFCALIIRILDSLNSVSLKGTIAVLIVLFCIFMSDLDRYNKSAVFLTIKDANLNNAHVSAGWRFQFEKYLHQTPHAKGSFVFSSQLTIFKPKDRHCLTKQLGSYVCYFTDDCNLPSITCRDSVLYDMSGDNRSMYEKTINWLNAFPEFTKDCNPVSYLKSGKFDYFICHINMAISDSSVIILPDTFAKTKMVYLKNQMALK